VFDRERLAGDLFISVFQSLHRFVQFFDLFFSGRLFTPINNVRRTARCPNAVVRGDDESQFTQIFLCLKLFPALWMALLRAKRVAEPEEFAVCSAGHMLTKNHHGETKSQTL
jgi:hypothetical protein